MKITGSKISVLCLHGKYRPVHRNNWSEEKPVGPGKERRVDWEAVCTKPEGWTGMAPSASGPEDMVSCASYACCMASSRPPISEEERKIGRRAGPNLTNISPTDCQWYLLSVRTLAGHTKQKTSPRENRELHCHEAPSLLESFRALQGNIVGEWMHYVIIIIEPHWLPTKK